MKLDHIDKGNEFDFGKTSNDYAVYRNIYPDSMYEKLISFGVVREGIKVLDLGSGTAILPINLSRIGAHFTTSDISENQIRFGKEKAASLGINNISFKVCSAENTGFPDNTFDSVTAVQCFHYFDPEKAAEEIFRVLRPRGLFCKIFMDWLPYKDDKIYEMEQLVLKYNPYWTGGGFEKFRYSFPAWAESRFDMETVHSYNAVLEFSKENWLGRIKSCRGVGASLTDEKLAAFESEYRSMLEKYDEPLQLTHQIHIEVYRSEKRGNE